jgi:hypothetical protein
MQKLTQEQIQEKIEEYCTLEYKTLSELGLQQMPKHMLEDLDPDLDSEEEEYSPPSFVQNNINTTTKPKTVVKARVQVCERCKREVQVPEGSHHSVSIQISSGNRGAYLREKCTTCKLRKNPFNGTWTLPVHESNRCYLVYEQYPVDSNAGMIKFFKEYGSDK